MNKVQKIREEVERLQKRAEYNFGISLTENERQFWLGESNVLTSIGKYIDTMQEEPVNNGLDLGCGVIWKDEEHVSEDLDLGCGVIWKGEKPASEQKLSNVERIGKNWKEESDLNWKDMSLQEKKDLLVSLQKDIEPVSDELEEAANNAVIALVPSFGQKYSDGSYVSSCKDSFKREELLELFKAGAKWQKEQIIKRLCNHANIDQMVEKFEDKYKPENVLDTEYYKRGIFDTIKTIKED